MYQIHNIQHTYTANLLPCIASLSDRFARSKLRAGQQLSLADAAFFICFRA